MTPTIRHLPLRPLDATQSNNMTPDEVTAWLNEREWQNQMRRANRTLTFAFWFVATVLLLATIGFFTH